MDKFKVIFVMILWGSVGVFTRFIFIEPSLLALCRAILSIPVLLVITILSEDLLNKKLIIKDVCPFIISGAFIGFAWLFLFLAFKHTSVATATLTYNMCPVYVLLLSPLLLKERLERIHIINVVLAFLGLIMIVLSDYRTIDTGVLGIAFGTMSGTLYAIIVIMNRKISTTLKVGTTTLIQMISASVVLLPVVIYNKLFVQLYSMNKISVTMLLILGFVHTGIGFMLYFSSYAKLSAISIALISYLEPVFAVFFAIIFIGEELSYIQVIGSTLILGSTFYTEIYKNWIGRTKLDGKVKVQ
ncbi:DMT family transporter [Clostridium sediminicola]|uniref:DMT family transporter n=1 Tax=Clostridium sediminicola TaxID=3114879 RepID=UPI0031F1C65F